MQMLLGNALLEQAKNEEAGEHFAEVIRIWPDNIQARCNLALTLVEQRRFDEAIESCRSALEIQPGEPKAHYILGDIYSKQGKLPDAIAEYRAALQIDPNFLFALNNLAWLLATAPDSSLRNGSEAVRLAEKACELSNHQVTVYLGTLGAAYAESGRFDDAIRTAQTAITLASSGKNTALIQKNRELLELYQKKTPFHEPTRAIQQKL
jgi:Flp pilus assembly protein TadD